MKTHEENLPGLFSVKSKRDLQFDMFHRFDRKKIYETRIYVGKMFPAKSREIQILLYFLLPSI